MTLFGDKLTFRALPTAPNPPMIIMAQFWLEDLNAVKFKKVDL